VLIPEATIESLGKYFPFWRWRDLVTQFGRSGEAPQALIDAVRKWEHDEINRAMDRDTQMSGPPPACYQNALDEFERLHAEGVAHDKSWRKARKSSRTQPPQPQPPPRPIDVHPEIAKLWEPPDPAGVNQGFAVDPEYLQKRLEDPACAQRYAPGDTSADPEGDLHVDE